MLCHVVIVRKSTAFIGAQFCHLQKLPEFVSSPVIKGEPLKIAPLHCCDNANSNPDYSNEMHISLQ